MNNNIVVSGIKYSLCALMSTLPTAMSFLSCLLSFFVNSAADANRLAHLNLTGDKSGHVRSLSCGSEPNLDVWTCTQSKLLSS